MTSGHSELINSIKKEVLAEIADIDLYGTSDETQVGKKVESLFNAFIKKHREIMIKPEDRQMILSHVVSDILGLGPIEKLIHDSSVSEIMVNGPDQVYVEKNGRLELSDVVFKDSGHLNYFVEKILSPLGRRVTEYEPYIDARLSDGSRVNVVSYPVSLIGTILTIRKFSHQVLTVDDLVRLKSLSHEAADFLGACVKARLNIVVAGGSGAGKTTTLNVLSNYINENERVITIEDTAELQIKGKHVLRLETRPSNIEGKGEITIRHLLKNSLHMRPDRIIVGEVRSNEVLDMLQAMTTGHEGSMTTLHSNSAMEALDRLEMLTLMDSPNISAVVAKRQIISAIDVIIYVNRFVSGARKISQIAELIKDRKMEFKLENIFSLSGEDDSGSELKFSGNVPVLYDKLKRGGARCELFEK